MDFIPKSKIIRSKDRVPFSCPKCNSVTISRVDNVKAQIKKLGTYRCWGCSVSEGKMKEGKMTKEDLKYYMELAKKTASLKSTDNDTQVGSILISSNNEIEDLAANSFVDGAKKGLPRTRPDKYQYIIHSERKLLFQACAKGIKTQDSTVLCTLSPCMECLRALKQAGVKEVIFKDCYPAFGDVVEFYTNNKEFEINVEKIEDLGYYRLEIN